jgi:Na+/H+-dicarboxylate symporter
LLDMTRTMVNVGSDMVTCAVVDATSKHAEERDIPPTGM